MITLRIKLVLISLIPSSLKQKFSQNYWTNHKEIYNSDRAPKLFNLANENILDIKYVLEFGSNSGLNLEYFLNKNKNTSVVGIDVNPIVKTLEGKYSKFKGIISNEKALDEFKKNEFNLSFTSSVLDHIANENLVINVIKKLAHISDNIILNEPYLEGIVGDVSGKFRYHVNPHLENSHKSFAKYSYFWNYDKYLIDMGLKFKKIPNPLHKFSMGPYYYLYFIQTSDYSETK